MLPPCLQEIWKKLRIGYQPVSTQQKPTGNTMKITIILTVLFLISLPSYGSSQSSSPNIVLIIADDVSAEDLGCYGCYGIKTPVMDRLAATGIPLR